MTLITFPLSLLIQSDQPTSILSHHIITACLEAGTAFTVEFLQNFGNIPLMLGDPGLITTCVAQGTVPCLFFRDALSKPFVVISLIRLGIGVIQTLLHTHIYIFLTYPKIRQ